MLREVRGNVLDSSIQDIEFVNGIIEAADLTLAEYEALAAQAVDDVLAPIVALDWVASDLAHADVDALSDDDLQAELDVFDQAEARLAAAKSARLAEYERRRLYRPTYRTASTARAHNRQMNGRHTGAELNLAADLTSLPHVWKALATSRITIEHARLLSRLFRRTHLRNAVIDDQEWLVTQAESLSWAEFEHRVTNWTEIVDPRDPADLDPGADKRRVTWSKGVGGNALIQVDTTQFMLEQFMACTQPVFDRLLEQEWADARAAFEAAGRNPDDVTTAHLARTNDMRRHDAMMILIRAGAAASTDESGPDDPGASVRVIVTVDLATLMWAAQAASRNGGIRFTAPQGPQPQSSQPQGSQRQGSQSDKPARPPKRDRQTDAEVHRCSTLGGTRLAPAFALWCALATHVERVTLDARDRSASLSSPARLFTPSQRLAMLARDKHCRGPGCARQPANNNLEADHITPHSRGGPTHTTNGQMLCRPCHRHKTWLQATGLWHIAEPNWNPNWSPD